MEFQGHISCPKLVPKKVFIQDKIDTFIIFFKFLIYVEFASLNELNLNANYRTISMWRLRI